MSLKTDAFLSPRFDPLSRYILFAMMRLRIVAAMGHPVEKGSGHFDVTKDRCPFAEAQIGGDHDAGAL